MRRRKRSLAGVIVVGLLLGSCNPPPSGAPTTVTRAAATTSTDEVGSTGSSDSPGSTDDTTPEFVRFIHPDEWVVVRAACLEEAGWLVEITPDQGIKFPDVTPEQSVEMEAANDLCGRRYPVDPKYRQPLTDDQLAFLYNWFLEELIPCLETEGYSGFAPPSLVPFQETCDVEPWSPVLDITQAIRDRGAGAHEELYQRCPSSPPVDELFSE